MHRQRPTLLLLVCAALAAACGPRGPRSVPPLATPAVEGSWTLSLRQTGGIAGVQLSVQVASTGDLTATDERSKRQVTKSLPPQTMDELQSLIAKADLAQAAPTSSSCADCFIYVLEFKSTTGVQRIQVDDVTLPASRAQALILYLRSLRDAALAPPP